MTRAKDCAKGPKNEKTKRLKMCASVIASIFLPGNFVAEISLVVIQEDGSDDHDTASSSGKRLLSVSLLKHGQKPCIGSTTVPWNEHGNPEVKWDNGTQVLEFNGEIDVVKLPMKLPISTAHRVGSKATADRQETVLCKKELRLDEEIKNIIDYIEKVCEKNASSQSLKKLLAFVEHIGSKGLFVPHSQQSQLLRACCQEKNAQHFPAFIKLGIFTKKDVLEDLVVELCDKGSPDLWLCFLESGDISENHLVLSLKASLQQTGDNEEWKKVREKVLEQPFSAEVLTKELNILSLEQGFELLQILKDQLHRSFLDSSDQGRLNVVIDWISAVLDVHGQNLLVEDRFLEEIEELIAFVLDVIHLLDSGAKLQNRIDSLKTPTSSETASRDYCIERLFLERDNM